MNTNSGISVKAIRLREHAKTLRGMNIPSTLNTPRDATAKVREAYRDAAAFYKDIAITGDAGVELASLGFIISKDEKQAALEVLRASGSVVESLEMRQGSKRRQRVFRPVHSNFEE